MQQTMRYHYGPRRRQATRRDSISRSRRASMITAAVTAQRRVAGTHYPGGRLIRYVYDVIKIAAVLGLMYAFLLLLFIHGG